MTYLPPPLLLCCSTTLLLSVGAWAQAPRSVGAPPQTAANKAATAKGQSLTYSLAWDEGQTPVAVGAKATSAHQATFTLTIRNRRGQPVPHVRAPKIEVISGGQGPHEIATAKVGWTTTTTDEQGKVKGIFTSGDRAEPTVIGVRSDMGGNTSKPLTSLRIDQVWSDLPAGNGKGLQWNFNPFFAYDVPSPVTYNMAFHRGGKAVDIPRHHLEFAAMKIVAQVWVAGIDVDGDGIADGDYVLQTFVRDEPGFADPVRPRRVKKEDVPRRSDLVVWNPQFATSSTGNYTSKRTIVKNPSFLIDTTDFDAFDDDAFDVGGEIDW